MINGLEGIPRSGKSYEATVFHVLVSLQQGYQVITNLPLNIDMFAAINPGFRDLIVKRTRAQPIRGTWDMNRVDENGNGQAFELFPDGHVEDPASNVPVFGHVWDYYTTWKHPVTKLGPKFVIDECHNALPKLGTPASLIEWFKLHGHFNVDVLLMTQNFRDICSSIATLMGMLVKVRKADILGKADHYIRKVHGGYRGAVISTEQRKYQPQYFGLYKSHTQGNSVAESLASDVKPFMVKWRRFQYGFWIFFVCVVAYLWWPSEEKKPPIKFKQEPAYTIEQREEQRVQAGISAALKHVDHPRPVGPPAELPAAVVEVPDPFNGKKLHLTGWMQLGDRVAFTFVVSDGSRRIFDLDLAELRKTGYAFRALGHCAGILTFEGKSQPVTCDAPVINIGSEDKPIVVTERVAVPIS